MDGNGNEVAKLDEAKDQVLGTIQELMAKVEFKQALDIACSNGLPLTLSI
jgi:hypothetical protein